MLYAVNTAGAAAGAFLTDFVLVPSAGLRATQMVAVSLNVIAGVGALWLARPRVTRGLQPAVRVKPRPPAHGPPEGGHYVHAGDDVRSVRL